MKGPLMSIARREVQRWAVCWAIYAATASTSAYAQRVDVESAAQLAQTLATREALAILGPRNRVMIASPDSDVGLFTRGANGEVVLPFRLFESAASLGEVRAMLALRVAAFPAANLNRANRVLSGVLAYAGLLVSEEVTARENANPARREPFQPPSELDIAPIQTDFGPTRQLVLAAALGRGGCERNAVALLFRLSRPTHDGAPLDRLGRDAREVIRNLGMFAHAPATACVVEHDAQFDSMKRAM